MVEYRDHRRQSKPTWPRWVAAVAVLLLLAGTGVVLGLHQDRTKATIRPAASTSTQQTDQQGITSRMLFVGDVFWGRKIQTTAQQSGLGYSYPTHGLSAADRASYDAWIANFECPITTHDVPYALQVSELKFNCRPEYLPNLAKWFTAVTNANNHTDNNGGMEGLAETRQNLEAAGIQHFGTYDMTQINDICDVISMPAETTGTHTKIHLPVAMCGYMYVTDATPTDEQLAVMKQYSKVMPVIAMPHMGIEYKPTAEPAKVDAYHRMIDNGADMVIGAHPHVIENSEDYKGRLIQYSEGNFLFDQQSLGRATTLGLSVGVKLTIPAGTAANAYEKLANTCSAYKDDCLSKLQAAGIKRPAIGVAYNITCYDESSGVPVLGTPAVCAEADKMATTDQLTGLSKQW